jgi:hypothetical protein
VAWGGEFQVRNLHGCWIDEGATVAFLLEKTAGEVLASEDGGKADNIRIGETALVWLGAIGPLQGVVHAGRLGEGDDGERALKRPA